MRPSQLLLGVSWLLPNLVHGFQNPIFWEDLADLDLRRIGDTYYYSASTMHFSPGAPILRSYDLVNWEYIGHSVPSLDFGDRYNLIGGRAYVGGVWASFLGYNSFRSRWYWGGCIDFTTSYIYSATSITGPYSRLTTINKCYYDCGLLVDDDGTMYVSYVYNQNIWMAQLSADGTSEVRSQQIYAPPSDIGYLEGTRPYKRNGVYYVLLTKPGYGTYMIKSSSPFGTYTVKVLVLGVGAPFVASNPHQGALIDTPSGQWYYMAFVGVYPGGRIPVLAPITWGSDGFPAVTLSGNNWALTYPDVLTPRPVASPLGTDYFTSLGPAWEWNHNPDTTKYSTGSSGLVLRTATVTADLYSARNTLTHRIHGPTSMATIKLNYSSMSNGDRAGLVVLRNLSGWIGVAKDNGAVSVRMVNGIEMNTDWTTKSTGTTIASASVAASGSVWLRATAEVAPESSKTAVFAYSLDGVTWTSLGNALTLNDNFQFFVGYRFGIFNYATTALGGSVSVSQFTIDLPGTTPPGTGNPSTTATTRPSTTSTTASSTSSSSTSRVTSTTTTSTSASGALAPHYGQCGGIGWTGPTQCEAPWKCTYGNDWYSQCL